MKKLIKDYGILWKASIDFCRSHWIAMLVYSIICVLLAFMPFIIDLISAKIKEKKSAKIQES